MAHCNSKPKKMKRGGTPSPIPMPESVKKRRENRRTRNDMTSVSKAMRDFIAKEDGKSVSNRDAAKIAAGMSGESGKSISDADKARVQNLLNAKKMAYGGKVKGYQNGGCVMSGRGGKFKGVS